MAHIVRDPKGYYIMLGLTPEADLKAVKAAYRARAKLLHPDRNPSPRASQEFAALTEAYRMLSDAGTRLAYDTGRMGGPQRAGAPSSRASGPTAASRDAVWGAGPESTLAPRTCRVCGRATADLRHRVLYRVRGRGRRVEEDTISGVFCRAHGDRTAVAASLYCWALGWWALPWGPVQTVRALWRNLWGGREAAEENYQLLAGQARAFLARGNLPLARVLAEQARPFAREETQKRHISQLLEALADQPRPSRREAPRRRQFGSAQAAQLAPLLLLLAVAFYIAGPTRVITGLLDAVSGNPSAEGPAPTPSSGPISGTTFGAAPPAALPPDAQQGPFSGRTLEPAARSPEAAAPSGPLFQVRSDGTILRAGPDAAERAVATLPAGMVVMATGESRDGAWRRVLSVRGASGFVPATALERVVEEGDP